MSEHDEMCPLKYALDNPEQHDEHCGWDPDNCLHYCQCALIRKARDAQRDTDVKLAEGMKLAEVLTNEDRCHNFGIKIAIAAMKRAND